jgi:dihydroflavonol-4-reductase
VWVARLVAAVGETISGVTKKPPLLPRGQLHFLGLHAVPSARRAEDEFGWRPTPFADALRRTLASFGLLDG